MGKPTFDYYNCEVVRLRSYVFGLIVIDIKVFYPEYIGIKGERRELKHLSTCRKGYQLILR